jgi:flavin reductase (DIM6/NTAB) family NADH-FMN oxidoreductase RutF
MSAVTEWTTERRVIRPKILYVGTPVFLVSTENPDGTFNLAPASSYWALGQMLVLGLETDGQTVQNLRDRPELTVNFPSGSHWEAVERLAALTARHPVPAAKADRYRHEPEKFATAGLHAEDSDLVAPPRVRECALQFEARVRRATPGVNDEYVLVEAEVVRVHASTDIVTDGDHIDPRAWHPLIYSFKHYFDIGEELGWTRSSSTAPSTVSADHG